MSKMFRRREDFLKISKKPENDGSTQQALTKRNVDFHQ